MQALSKADYGGYLKGITNKVKQYALNLSEIELKVEEATNNEPWGPHGTAMGEIAKAAYDMEGYKQIMGVIARRLQDTGESWRHVYKSLLLLEFMAKHGPQKVVEELVSNVTVIEKLQSFQYKDKNGKDWGLNVRQRAKELTNLVLDGERIRAERSKAKSNETKYKGLSSDDWRSGGQGTKSGFGGGRGKGVGIGNSLGGKTPSDDAVAATKARIDAIRKDGTLDESPRKADAIPAVSAVKAAPKPAAPAAAADSGQRQPKKLSEVKPTVQLSLGNFAPPPSAAPAPAAAAATATAPKPSQAAAAPSAANAATSHVEDLLGGMTLDAPAAPSSGSATNASEWNSFAAPAAAPAASSDPFATFGDDRSGSGAKPAASADPFGSSDPFGAMPTSRGASSSDPFASAPTTPAQASHDPFAMAPTPPAKSSSDPFALGAAPASSAGDPFADFASAPRAHAAKSTSDPFAASSNGSTPRSPGKPGSLQALPEDMFSARPQPQQLPRQPAAFGMQQFGQGTPGFPVPSQQAGGFPGMVGFMPQPGMGFPGAGTPQASFPQYNLGMQMGAFQNPQQGFAQMQGQRVPAGLQSQQLPGSPSVGSLGLSGLSVPPSGAAAAKKDPFADLSAF
ncbi:hypothetical protein WJX74_007569 [Apatococcus lobatus]|uniref:ENTH domain-containing protein n=1 Tax=Apatococcus lobatus TaxID=904363 RepID=A0AAW1QJT8_9CHLO